MELQRTSTPNLNITSEAQVFSYTYTGASPLEVIARIDMGDVTKPIQGNGTYVMNFYINGVLVTPTSSTLVPVGVTKTIVVSRPVPIYTNDTVTLKVIGLAGDTSVDLLATLRTATPLQKTDIYGTGPVAVDQNYGGTNALAYLTALGAGIIGASIFAYLTSDYNAGNRGQAFLQGRTLTVAGGAWQAPLMLTPLGISGGYTLMFFLPPAYGPDVVQITV